jgi:hypothetical protein
MPPTDLAYLDPLSWIARRHSNVLPRQAKRGASYPELEIIAKLATVLEVEPAELLRVRSAPRLSNQR